MASHAEVSRVVVYVYDEIKTVPPSEVIAYNMPCFHEVNQQIGGNPCAHGLVKDMGNTLFVCWTGEELSEDIGQVHLARFMTKADTVACTTFPNFVICNCIMLFIQSGFRDAGIFHNRFIIAETIGQAINWDAQHM